MRNHHLTLLFLLTMTANATDRIVAPGATLPRYASISAALSAAADNDRILVVPSIYTENLTIDKSVEILSMVPGRRYTATGNLLIAPPVQTVKRIVVHDLELLGNIITGGQVNHPNIIVLTGW